MVFKEKKKVLIFSIFTFKLDLIFFSLHLLFSIIYLAFFFIVLMCIFVVIYLHTVSCWFFKLFIYLASIEYGLGKRNHPKKKKNWICQLFFIVFLWEVSDIEFLICYYRNIERFFRVYATEILCGFVQENIIFFIFVLSFKTIIFKDDRLLVYWRRKVSWPMILFLCI